MSPSTLPFHFQPSLFVKLSQHELEAKTQALAFHSSQKNKPFMCVERIRALATIYRLFLRMEDSEAYFEPFEVHKIVA